MNFNLIRDRFQLLTGNYRYLFSLYRLGKFESEIDRNQFQPYGSAGDIKPTTVKFAADNLYLLACDLEDEILSKNSECDSSVKESATELILRAKVLSYEIDDYFLSIPKLKSEQFICLSKEISVDIAGYIATHYDCVSDPHRRRKIIQYLLLTAVCGVNESYRQHNKDAYEDGLSRGEKILDYIRYDLPRMKYPPRSGQGLVGLCCYVLGRLNFVLGYYEKADSYFRQSLEAYSERVQMDSNDSQESLLATLRRSALVSAFGCAYLALIDGRVREAITLSALARVLLKQNCGAVHAAYVDLIYWAAKRAEASSDKHELIKIGRGLRRCRRIFQRYVPSTHYVHRAGIQLGIAYHYLAQAYPERRDRYYRLASSYLTQAVTFAKSEVDQRHRNQRLLAEGLVILSHITSNSGIDKFGTDLEQAAEAREAAFGITQYICESDLAQAAIYCKRARESISEKEITQNANDARHCASRALSLNANGSARIRAAGYLRLADISFLRPNTVPDVHHYYEKWLAVKDFVQHDFLHKWADRINERMMEERQHLFIDASVTTDRYYWNAKVEEYLMNAVVREFAKEYTGSTKKKRSTPGAELRKLLVARFRISESSAYNKIHKYRLIERFEEYSH